MKTIYIPNGETVHYESLVTDRLVVQGCVDVDGSIKAKIICGGGAVYAGAVHADIIHVDDLETSETVCKRLLAKRVHTPTLIASECAAVSCYLSAGYVETGKLTVAVSEIDQLKADEVVNLSPQKRGLLCTLIFSALQSFWVSVTAPGLKREPDTRETTAEMPPEDQPVDLDPSIRNEITKTVEEILQQNRPASHAAPSADEEDFELKRIVNIFRLLREHGYTLRIIPGTPEENAPILDFEESETVLRPAA